MANNLLRYANKVVIVTGGISGIGLATVKQFVLHGAHVVFCSKASEEERGRVIERDLQASGCAGDACFQVCDVRKESEIKLSTFLSLQRLIRFTIQRYGCLNCLVNNAGNGYKEALDDVTAQDFNSLMDLNVVSYLLVSKCALPYLRQTKGNIVNMASLHGMIGMKDFLSSTTTKGAVIAMTKAMAIDESKYGVRVNRNCKVVIVTGGTSGIGLAIVREFVRQGAKVVFCSRASGAKKGQAIVKELQASGCPGEAYYQVCDVRKEEDIKQLVLATVERYGCLDCLVNNVGTGHLETIDNVRAQDFRNLMEINAVSCLLASKHALPYLRQTKGNIVNMASVEGVFGVQYGVLYASSKGAVIAMTKALAIDESKYGVRVNCISPGHVWSPLMKKLASQLPNPEEALKTARDYQLLGRWGTTEEVALAALYLAADGTFCTGLNLLVTGGAEVGFGKKSQVDSKPETSAAGNSQGSSSKQ